MIALLHLHLILWLLILFPLLVEAAETIRISWADSSVTVRSLSIKKAAYLCLEDLSQFPVTTRSDSIAGLMVLCSQVNCIPVFMIDPEDYRVDDGTDYIRADRLAEALGCQFEIKRAAASLACDTNPELLQPVGSDSGDCAPGYRSQHETSTVIAFLRSLDWDPFSRMLASRLQSISDSLHAAGVQLVGIHGYGRQESDKWQDSLKLSYPLFADSASAVMRGYNIFDRGNLPHPALFLIDAQGVIRLRQVFDDLEAPPDLTPLMQSIEKTRN